MSDITLDIELLKIKVKDYPSLGYTDVISEASFNIIATDTDGTSVKYFSTVRMLPTFVLGHKPFDEVTEEDVKSWIRQLELDEPTTKRYIARAEKEIAVLKESRSLID